VSKEIISKNGYPIREWAEVEIKPKRKCLAPVGGKVIYLAAQLRIIEGECEGMEVSPKNPNILIRNKTS